MKLTAECECGNQNMRFDTETEDLGWHCDGCGAFWGLTVNDMELYRCAYNMGIDNNKHEVDLCRRFRSIIKELI